MMKTRLIATLLVVASAAVAAPAFANPSTVTRAQVRAELAQLEKTGYAVNRASDATYPGTVQAALSQLHADDAIAGAASRTAYGSDGNAATQSGRRAAVRVAERSVYFGH
ncbi:MULTISPECIES: DUF4148 domain-containing protein [Burkholderia]|jgi:hypothetical protein|uniref:Purine nucleoside phosphorylase n=1 Tax=Burkholderia multivorans CGD2 TaxID=513052 RepID=B9BM81_9BURK|nr:MULTISPECIES: DUF4148 domain-containing protein [Burkholderia]AVR22155.1 DUF4148 domain-containing protein [Burkholderia multivorans]EEE07741.1 conserved hypothetical protein [Burkholderia multivorans CGD2]EEE14321.1 conserved hypothetical protein [Burkholderia multivorans CGD2M]EJO57072.1 hypothetical protein BURMUCF1_1577 [Burkholderia multivorans ATCC BAA-247]KVS08023.1 hypothetical protein WK33_26610 [Burkholderia multivorans]